MPEAADAVACALRYAASEMRHAGRRDMEIGRIGVWTFEFEQQPWSAIAEAAAEIDELGYGAIWFPESRGREVMAQSALLLGATKRAVIAPGIEIGRASCRERVEIAAVGVSLKKQIQSA